MTHDKVSGVEKFITDFVGVLTAMIGVVALAEALLNLEAITGTLPLVTGTILSLLAIGFGIILTTHGATKALRQMRKTLENIKN